MTFQEWKNETNQKFAQQIIQRKGQFFYNSLHEHNRMLANKICGGEYDPFHRDDRLDLFMAYVYLNWENGEGGKTELRG